MVESCGHIMFPGVVGASSSAVVGVAPFVFESSAAPSFDHVDTVVNLSTHVGATVRLDGDRNFGVAGDRPRHLHLPCDASLGKSRDPLDGSSAPQFDSDDTAVASNVPDYSDPDEPGDQSSMSTSLHEDRH